MDLATSFTAATSAITMTKGLLKVAFDAKVDAEAKIKVQEAREKLNEIQDVIYELKDELFRLQDSNRDLNLKVGELTANTTTLESYELIQCAGGAVVYRYKFSPDHYACPACFADRSVQILQDSNSLAKDHVCNKCRSRFDIKQRTPKNSNHLGVVKSRGGGELNPFYKNPAA
jgi:hypothetical protein